MPAPEAANEASVWNRWTSRPWPSSHSRVPSSESLSSTRKRSTPMAAVVGQEPGQADQLVAHEQEGADLAVGGPAGDVQSSRSIGSGPPWMRGSWTVIRAQRARARSIAPSCQSSRARRRWTSRCAGISSASASRMARAASCRSAAIAASNAVSLARQVARMRRRAAPRRGSRRYRAWPWRRASWASCRSGSTRQGSAERASSMASARRVEPAQRLGHQRAAEMGARLVGCQGDGGGCHRGRRLAPSPARPGRRPDPSVAATCSGRRLERSLEMVAGGREIALARRELGRRRGAAPAPAGARRRGRGRGRRRRRRPPWPPAPDQAAGDAPAGPAPAATRVRAWCSAADRSPSTSERADQCRHRLALAGLASERARAGWPAPRGTDAAR